MKNYFLQKEVPGEIEDYASLTREPVDIVESDLPYFMLRDPGDEPLDPIKAVPMLKVVDMAGYAGDVNRILDELHFLYVMGLVVLRGSVYYMLPTAIDLFYGPDGFFNIYSPTDTLERRVAAIAPLQEHMRMYVLPGRWLRAYYAKRGLAPTVQPFVGLEREMQEIEAVLGHPMK
jgi:hypothetical protein